MIKLAVLFTPTTAMNYRHMVDSPAVVDALEARYRCDREVSGACLKLMGKKLPPEKQQDLAKLIYKHGKRKMAEDVLAIGKVTDEIALKLLRARAEMRDIFPPGVYTSFIPEPLDVGV